MRPWIYSTVTGDATIMALLPGGFAEGSSMVERPSDRPYATYRFGTPTPVFKDNNVTISFRTYVSFYVHDKMGTFERIDAIVARLRTIFEPALPTPANKLIRMVWEDDSDDLPDPDLNDVLRISRYSMYHKP